MTDYLDGAGTGLNGTLTNTTIKDEIGLVFDKIVNAAKWTDGFISIMGIITNSLTLYILSKTQIGSKKVSLSLTIYLFNTG